MDVDVPIRDYILSAARATSLPPVVASPRRTRHRPVWRESPRSAHESRHALSTSHRRKVGTNALLSFTSQRRLHAVYVYFS